MSDGPKAWVRPASKGDRRKALALNTLLMCPLEPLTGDKLRWLLATLWVMVAHPGAVDPWLKYASKSTDSP